MFKYLTNIHLSCVGIHDLCKTGRFVFRVVVRCSSAHDTKWNPQPNNLLYRHRPPTTYYTSQWKSYNGIRKIVSIPQFPQLCRIGYSLISAIFSICYCVIVWEVHGSTNVPYHLQVQLNRTMGGTISSLLFDDVIVPASSSLSINA